MIFIILAVLRQSLLREAESISVSWRLGNTAPKNCAAVASRLATLPDNDQKPGNRTMISRTCSNVVTTVPASQFETYGFVYNI